MNTKLPDDLTPEGASLLLQFTKIGMEATFAKVQAAGSALDAWIAEQQPQKPAPEPQPEPPAAQ